MDKLKVVDLFAGVGGLSYGFARSENFEILLANDYEKDIAKAYSLNHPTVNMLTCDIKNITETQLNDLLKDPIDIIVGGPPCQSYSTLGKRQMDDRAHLFEEYCRILSILKPKVFVYENVSGLLSMQGGNLVKKIVARFNALGYDVKTKLLNSVDYGVQQYRERVFIVGTRNDIPKFIPPTAINTKPVTAKEAIGDLELLKEDRAFSHIWSLANASGEQGNRRLIANRPGYTIRAECHGNIQFHYELPRRISMREAARIQSFPDNFRFASKLRETERQIGNAVPPVLGWYVAKAVESLIERESL